MRIIPISLVAITVIVGGAAQERILVWPEISQSGGVQTANGAREIPNFRRTSRKRKRLV